MGIQITFPDDFNAEQVANKLAYWATIMAQGNKVVVAALQNAEQKKAEAEKGAAAVPTDVNPNGDNENVIDLAKAAKTREAKKAKAGAKVEQPKPAKKPDGDKLTEAQVRTIMIDYVNAAAPALKASRKEVFEDLLNNFGVKKVVELPEANYQAMVDLVEQRTRELEKMVAGE